MADAGMWGGDPEAVMRSRVDRVMQAFHFLQFKGVYDHAMFELNKPKE